MPCKNVVIALCSYRGSAGSGSGARRGDQRPPAARRSGLSRRGGALGPRLEALPELLELGRDHGDAIRVSLALVRPIVLVIGFRRPPVAHRLYRGDDAPAELLIRPGDRFACPAVLLFALLATGFTCLLFGILPAMRATRVETGDALRSGSRGSQSRQRAAAQQVLVTAEVALCLVLLVAAALLLRSWQRVLRVDPGFRPDGLALPTWSRDPSGAVVGSARAPAEPWFSGKIVITPPARAT